MQSIGYFRQIFKNLNFLDIYMKNTKISNFMKMRLGMERSTDG